MDLSIYLIIFYVQVNWMECLFSCGIRQFLFKNQSRLAGRDLFWVTNKIKWFFFYFSCVCFCCFCFDYGAKGKSREKKVIFIARRHTVKNREFSLFQQQHSLQWFGSLFRSDPSVRGTTAGAERVPRPSFVLIKKKCHLFQQSTIAPILER